MIARVVGVVRTGAVPAAGAKPLAPYRQDLDWPLTEDGTIVIRLVDEAGAPVPITGQLIFTVRRRVTDTAAVIVRTATILSVPNGEAGFPVLAADVYSTVKITEYVYDIFYVDGAGLRFQVVLPSSFDVGRIVGRPGEPITIPGVDPPTAPPIPGLFALASGSARAVAGQNEQLVEQVTFDFNLLTAPTIFATLSAITEQTDGATGTYRVRLGGLNNTPDGVEVLALLTTHASFTIPPDTANSVPFATPPAGPTLVKLTARASTPAGVARIRHYQIAFKTV